METLLKSDRQPAKPIEERIISALERIADVHERNEVRMLKVIKTYNTLIRQYIEGNFNNSYEEYYVDPAKEKEASEKREAKNKELKEAIFTALDELEK